MATQMKKTKLATAVATAVVGLGLSAAANAVVVVGGDNGWEVSFDGNINAFYVQGNNDAGFNGLGLVAPNSPSPVPNSGGHSTFAGNAVDTSRVTSGFLPAFFSFNVKSPTVNGMTGTARFSFAPQITNGNTKNQLYAADPIGLNGNNGIQGSSIDMREVLVNLSGGFGTVSFGRTLSIFGRNAILKDMTLFGVGVSNQQGAAVTAGRIGRGYTYPNFNARFSYKTPNFGGLQAEFGIFDPSIDQLNTNAALGLLDQTQIPRFEGEVSYTATFSGGSVQGWVDGLYQEIKNSARTSEDHVVVGGVGFGAEGKFNNFALTGYYYTGNGLGRALQFAGGTACNASVVPVGGTTGNVGIGGSCEATDDDGYYVQGTYTFSGKTKLGLSYGESRERAFSDSTLRLSGLSELQARDVTLSMWTVGVYHDVNSWLKVIAEYSKLNNDYGSNVITGASAASTKSDTFSVGSFFFW